MHRIFIKYNPYKLQTLIQVDGADVKNNSRLNFGDRRLQEWIDELPEILCEELNSDDFEIEFHGTYPDYEDVLAMSQEAMNKNIHIKVKHIPAKEVKDKEVAIEEIFKDIQKGPFEELKQTDVERSFRLAIGSDFEVNVIATMSAGKSTLINSLLGQRLMPAKQEACTATITEIKDNDLGRFIAKVYDRKGKIIESYDNLTYEIMEKLNSNPSVSKIRVEGDIPFVTAEDVSLVLVDTPGPNNSRDPEHRAATYRMLSESSKTLVLYILNATQLAVDDDNRLLNYVADSMKVGGKQSRDRFIFVVNKLDDFKNGQDSIEGALNNVREYLLRKGIVNPNIYPASALTALHIRTTLTKSDGHGDDDIDEVEEAQLLVRKFNRNKEKHFEQYAPLPPSVKDLIAKRLQNAIDNDNADEQALIHSGIVPIEEAIRMYVRKYAKTAKIKNVVDTFMGRIESAQSFQLTKQQITQNEALQQSIIDRIELIENKLANGTEVGKFKSQIESVNYDNDIRKIADNIITEAQKQITVQLTNSTKMTRHEAEEMCRRFTRFAEDLQARVQVDLENLISNTIQKNAKDLLEIYKTKLADLVNDVCVDGIEISPLEIMRGHIPVNFSNDIISSLSKKEKVVTGQKWVENRNKKWYKPWTWFSESGHYEDVVEYKEYIDGTGLAQKFFAPLQESLYNNSMAATEYAKQQTKIIKKDFSAKFDELDKVLKDKLDELKQCANDKKEVAVKLDELNKKMKWLEGIQNRVNEILDI